MTTCRGCGEPQIDDDHDCYGGAEAEAAFAAWVDRESRNFPERFTTGANLAWTKAIWKQAFEVGAKS